MDREVIKSSIVVIGYQQEDHKMYPHLHDFLVNLRTVFDEVVYFDDDDRGDGLYSIDILRQQFLSVRGIKAFANKIRISMCSYCNRFVNIKIERSESRCYNHYKLSSTEVTSFRSVAKDIFVLLKKYALFFVMRRRLHQKLSNMALRNEKRVVLAIDHTAVYHALKFSSGNVVLWSFDIPTKDYEAPYHMRKKNGCYEKYITSAQALMIDTVLIQDEKRKLLLEEALDIKFKNAIYLPVGLNDSEFCKIASFDRSNKIAFESISIIQSGGIGRHRYSSDIVESFQNWPVGYELTFHGDINNNFKDILRVVSRKPHVSSELFNHDSLPSFLNKHDIGFVGYGEKDSNHSLIENASAQLVAFLRLGMPVIACGSSEFNDFISKNSVGTAISSFDGMQYEIEKIISNYVFYSRNARNLFETRFNLQKIFRESIVSSIEAVMMPTTTLQ